MTTRRRNGHARWKAIAALAVLAVATVPGPALASAPAVDDAGDRPRDHEPRAGIVDDGPGLPQDLMEKVEDLKEDVLSAAEVCLDSEGDPDVFVVKDKRTGPNYDVTILYGLTSGDVRAAWNAQIPRTYEGVNTYLRYRTWGPWGPWTVEDNRRFEAAITGGCGAYIGNPDSYDRTFDVQIDFGGTDVTYTHSQGKSVSLSVSVRHESTFSVSADPTGPEVGGSVTVGFEVTGTYEVTETTTVSVHGYKKTFKGWGYSESPFPDV